MPSYAVVSGKKVSSITIYHVNNGALYPMGYKYEYDEDGNVIEIDFEGEIYKYVYDDELIPYSLPFDPLINGIHRSANMISTMCEDESCLSFSYKRNEDGDIERIDVTNLYYGYYYYYLIEYCD